MILYVVPCDHYTHCESCPTSGGFCAIDHFKVGMETRIAAGACMKHCTERVHRGRKQRVVPGWIKPKTKPGVPNRKASAAAPRTDIPLPPIRLSSDWPFWLKPMLMFRRPTDMGLGDIIHHNPGARAYRGILDQLDKECRTCGDNHVNWNRRFPLRHTIVLKEKSAGAGDAVALTGVVREFKAHYGDDFDIHVTVPPGGDFWRNHPDCSYGDAPNARPVNVSGYNRIDDGKPRHLMQKYMHSLCAGLGLPELPVQTLRGDLHLTDHERDFAHWEAMGVKKPFMVMVAGGNSAWTVKWWDSEHYQAVADSLISKGVQVVQVGHGAGDNWHNPINGALNLVGRTNIRQLASLISHSEYVVCGVTAAMHIAAAVQRPAFVIGGGGEEVEMYRYPGHVALSTIGELDCCKTGGCWRRRCTVPVGEHEDNACAKPVRIKTRWHHTVDRRGFGRIGVFSLATDSWKELRDLTWPTMQSWCERHGYEFVTETKIDEARPASWSKIPLLQKHLDRFDWMLWIDADAIVFDQETRLERYLDEHADLIIAADDISTINCGVMAMRSCDGIKQLLADIWSAPESEWRHCWWEQQALRKIIGAGNNIPHSMLIENLKKSHGVRMKLLGPRPQFNCFVQWARHMPSPLIIHAPANDWKWKADQLRPFVGGDKFGVVIPECMKLISPSRVISACEQLLGGHGLETLSRS